MNLECRISFGKVTAILLISVFVFGNMNSRAEKLGNLPEITKDPRILVWKNRIYILDGRSCKIHIYSKSPLKYLKSFGGKGAGPGEFISTPAVPIVHGETIFVDGDFRVSLFSEEGELLKIIKTPTSLSRVIPVGANFLCQKINWRQKPGKDGRFFSTVALYNSTFKKIKEISDKIPGNTGMIHRSKKRVPYFHFRDCIKYDASEDLVVFGDTRKGFYFQILSDSGEIVREIKLPYKERIITPEIKQNAIAQSEAGMDYLLGNKAKRLKIKSIHEFPKKIPAIKNFFVSNNKIYAFPYTINDEGVEVIVIGLNGKALKKRVIAGLDSITVEIFPLCIDDDSVYYIIDNFEEEEWELHKEDLK